MTLPLIPNRPILQLKKRIGVPPPVAPPLVVVRPPVVVAPVKKVQPKPPKPPASAEPVKKVIKKPPNPAKSAAEKERLQLVHLEWTARTAAKKVVDIARVMPVLQAYLRSKPVLSETVRVDGVDYLRPLALEVRKTIMAWLRAQPEALDCSGTLLGDLIDLAMKPHVDAPQYLAGVLKFDERFDLEGKVCGRVSAKHRKNATKKQEKQVVSTDVKSVGSR